MKGTVIIPKQVTLLKYQPCKGDQSEIMTPVQMSNLVATLPSFYRGCDWKRIYKMNEDGCSLITFFT